MAEARYAKRVMHSPDDLLEMVADVERYPEFVDLISELRITKREERSATHTAFEAEAVVSYKMINEVFASKVDVLRDQHKIVVTKSDRGGAVKSLLNEWVFHPLPDGSTLVEFFVAVKLKAFFLDGLLAQKFESAATQIMDKFEVQADRLYAKVGSEGYDASADIARLGLQGAVQMA